MSALPEAEEGDGSLTLEEGKRKVLMLLDEYSSGGELTVDEDIRAKMNDFFDIAQKDVAQWQPILRRRVLTLDGSGSRRLPADVGQVTRIRKNGRRTADYEVIDGCLVSEPGDVSALTLDYLAVPETITRTTDDGYVFEVSEAAANCTPFFVAAQQLIPDLVIDYAAFYQIYLQMRGMLSRSAGGNGGRGGVRQILFRGAGR